MWHCIFLFNRNRVDVMLGKTSRDQAEIVRKTYIAFIALICVWIIAWIVKIQLDKIAGKTDLGSFIYWTTAKLLIWIAPALWLIRLSGRNLKQVFNLPNYKRWLLWGAGVGLILALPGMILNYVKGTSILQNQFDYGLVNALVISPIFEELLIHGAIMGNLQMGYSFMCSNLISALMFVMLHLPGWYFMGTFISNLTRIDGVISIFVIGLMCGYAVKRSNSVLGGMIAHFINNLV